MYRSLLGRGNGDHSKEQDGCNRDYGDDARGPSNDLVLGNRQRVYEHDPSLLTFHANLDQWNQPF